MSRILAFCSLFLALIGLADDSQTPGLSHEDKSQRPIQSRENLFTLDPQTLRNANRRITEAEADIATAETSSLGILQSYTGISTPWFCPPDDLGGTPSTATNLHAKAASVLRSSSKEVRGTYETLFGKNAAAQLSDAQARGHLRSLARVAREFRFTQAGTTALYTLMTGLYERGDTAIAALYLKGLLSDLSPSQIPDDVFPIMFQIAKSSEPSSLKDLTRELERRGPYRLNGGEISVARLNVRTTGDLRAKSWFETPVDSRLLALEGVTFSDSPLALLQLFNVKKSETLCGLMSSALRPDLMLYWGADRAWISPDHKYVVLHFGDSVRLVPLGHKGEEFKFEYQSSAEQRSFSPDQTKVVISVGASFYVVDLASGNKKFHTIFDIFATSARFSRDGRFIFAGDNVQTAIFDAKSGRQLHRITSDIAKFDDSPIDGRLAYFEGDKLLTMEPDGSKEQAHGQFPRTHDSPVRFSRDGKLLLTDDLRFLVLDAQSGSIKFKLDSPPTLQTFVAQLTSDSKQIIVSSKTVHGSKLTKYDLISGKVVNQVDTGKVFVSAISSDGSKYAREDDLYARSFSILNFDSGEVLDRFAGQDQLRSMAFTDDGNYLQRLYSDHVQIINLMALRSK